ncbi:MAG TPA: carboxypeptidase regulatory-like domain-containing protein [Candidatus Dormibacteraeota bacterium]|nr:carboxypeptidase regulatory-like domain-containing protein [Candidatus Dormibacteraeota bacterium]
MKPIFKLAYLFALLLLVARGARAQGVGSSGDIKGTVTDVSNAVLPKVTIVVVAPETGFQRTTVTDDSGQYRVTGLSPSVYDVSVQLPGFQGEIRKGVSVTVGQTVIVDFQLKVSQLTSQVEVTSEAPIIDTERTSQADTIEELYIKELPINRRDYLTYTLLVPGVSDSTRQASDTEFRVKQTPHSGLSFYGSNGRGNSVTVDGGEFNDDSGGVRPNLSQDAVQEFQINRSNYTAELGGAGGASINIVSKSGTNQLHGSLNGFFRNDVFDARDPFAFSQALQPGAIFNPAQSDTQGQPIKDSLSRQQYGGTLGLPIKKDKSFLFVAFEGLRQDAQNAVPLLTNTNIFRPQSDPANNQVAILNALAARGAAMVPCFNGQPPMRADACAVALGNALTVAPNAAPGRSTSQAARNAFLNSQFETNGGVFPFTTREYQTSARFDHQFSEQNQIFLRYSYVHDLEENPDVQSLTGFSRGSSIHTYDHTLQGSWFHLFSPRTSNEARLQFSYNGFNVLSNTLGQVGLDIPGFGNLGNQIFLPNLTITRRYEFADNFTMTRGHHTMKMGGYGLIRGNHSESHTFFPGRFVFGNLNGGLLSLCLAAPAAACGLTGVNPVALDSLQTVSLGLPQFYQQGFDNPVYAANRPFAAGYWQDSWAIRPNFTLHYGLRYELDVQYGNLNTDKDNFAPRVSFAWDPFNSHKTVIRGGYGIFYSPVYSQIPNVVQTLGVVNGFRQIAQVFVPLTGAPGNPSLTSAKIFQTLFAQGKVQCATPAPGNDACITKTDLAQPSLNIAVTHTGPIPPLSVIFSGQPGYQNPYSEQGEFGIEREIGGGFSVSASYIYVHTLKLPVAIDTNNAQILKLPSDQQFATVKVRRPDGTLTDSAPIRQWGAGNSTCTADLSKCFVNPLLLQTDQYSSQGSALYQGAILEIKKRFSQHYTFMGNYTFSKAIDTTTDFNSDYGPNDQTDLAAERGLSSFDQRHKVVLAGVFQSPWQDRILSGFELCTIFRYNSAHPFNLLAGTNVNNDRHSTTDRPPAVGRNTGIGPNYVSFDMRLSRQFKLTEKASLQLMAEGFNIFNRTNFGSVNNVVGVIAPPAQPLRGDRALSPSQPLGFTSALPKRQLQFGLRFSF